MARELRVEFPGVIYDVMNRGERREAIFRDEQPGTASGNDGRTHQGGGMSARATFVLKRQFAALRFSVSSNSPLVATSLDGRSPLPFQ